MTSLAPPPWQETIKQSLIQRNTAEQSYSTIIDQYRKLARQTRQLKDRNQALLRAATTIRSDARGSGGGGGGGDENPVLQAYVGSLEGQVSALRNELSDVYKMQGQNTQKLLTMTENLQEKEHQARVDQEELRRLTEGETKWKKGTDEWQARLKEKDVGLQILQDEISTLNLELNHTTARNEALKKDNASLLQRWIDKMNDEVEHMNLALEATQGGFSAGSLFDMNAADGASSERASGGEAMEDSGVLVPRPASHPTEGGDGWELLGTEDADEWQS